MSNFWLNEGIKAMVLTSAAYLLGMWVITRGVRVNYTRKILHFLLFFVPLYLAPVIPYQSSTFTIVAGGCIVVLCILALAESFRRRSVFLRTAFAGIDRPEDRPFTLAWLTTQVLATYVVLIAVVAWLQTYEKLALIYITVLVAAIGDGLAEPVGVRFGRHTYRVKALFTGRTYTRSLEGSACVWSSGGLAVLLLRDHLSLPQLVLGLLLIPAITTRRSLVPSYLGWSVSLSGWRGVDGRGAGIIAIHVTI
jgi:dolichol kinase